MLKLSINIRGAIRRPFHAVLLRSGIISPKLMPETGNWEPNALAEIYRCEIFSKIDPKTYGM